METGDAVIEIEALWDLIDGAVLPLDAEPVSPEEALGRALAEPAVTPEPMPPFDASAMDGYAFAEVEPGVCAVGETVAAGSAPERALRPGVAARIFTGAPVPEGAACVARQEDCAATGGEVRLAEGVTLSRGENIRERGAVAAAGDRLMPDGAVLTPGGVALLAAAGVGRVAARRAPRVLHLVTGSELIGPGEAGAPGKIRDSNGPMVAALLAGRGVMAERQRMPDDPALLSEAVGAFGGDLLLVSGGSGPGDHDHAARALASGGFRVLASRVNSRPGKPLLFAVRGGQVAFGLPGNPLSHWVCFHAFVARALARMRGVPPPEAALASCPGWCLPPGDGRRTWTPGRRRFVPGGLEVDPLEWKHSGDLTPLVFADALLLDGPDPANKLARVFFL